MTPIPDPDGPTIGEIFTDPEDLALVRSFVHRMARAASMPHGAARWRLEVECADDARWVHERLEAWRNSGRKRPGLG